jgi:hypothetical protein
MRRSLAGSEGSDSVESQRASAGQMSSPRVVPGMQPIVERGRFMKALTICQPYAHLILRGAKRVENREWPTNYRGRLYIHAGKSRSWLGPIEDGKEIDYGIPLASMAFGAVVAIATLADCVHIDKVGKGMAGQR